MLHPVDTCPDDGPEVQHNGSNGRFYAQFHRILNEDLTLFYATNAWHRDLAGGSFGADLFQFLPYDE